MTNNSQILNMDRFSDQFYRLSTSIAGVCKKSNYAVVFASCNSGEGVSTIALNYTNALAKDTRKRILFVDGNLRNPILHQHFRVGRENGLVELIQGETSLKDVVLKVEAQRLYFISSGRPVENPIILFESVQFSKIMEKLKSIFDFIIFDSAPVLRFPETTTLASRLDGLIMVLQAESTRWEVAQVAKSSLERADVRVFGAILNKKEFFIPQKIYRLL